MNQTRPEGNAPNAASPDTVAPDTGAASGFILPEIAQVPAGWTFAALSLGLGGGLVLAFAAPQVMPGVLAVAGPVGDLWLRALQATILPLVAALIFTGVVQTANTASAGGMARQSLGLFLGVLAFGALVALTVPTLLLTLLPIPASAASALRASLGAAVPSTLPGIVDYLRSIVATNVFDAAANDHMLPVILFMSVFALATTRLHPVQRDLMAGFFAALAGAMLVVIGWVLALAPIGVLALSLTVAAKSGPAAVGALAHYIFVVTASGGVVFLAAYPFAALISRLPLGRFVREMIPVQVFALSTQSSLASLPSMLGACERLGVRVTTAEFVLPLAVALFRATSPAMNLAVVVYVAHWYGVPLSLGTMATGWAMAVLVSLSSVSLPGTISYVATVGPIALAMGVPVAPLALLVAVEIVPDLMRTLGNVTFDVAVTAAVDRKAAD
ncbi:sodium:dicarboxylate symporter [Novosphingobium nitrogenifigens DSM 19370]|uniref:Sodium:dicarboxylate symporter n=1 Tax=Novosphingobium nitrogenifigens DSM 19370 TaxID=983920 RepID=F1ZDW3_9SPHN|nr:cation:dicarboxylase symporter family transporter [Novosphingobium nitrogenifigens]EGD57200.1 sodium:dicarboxylate symporter [Novosphingobium nitrogenifigens DSM 19370]